MAILARKTERKPCRWFALCDRAATTEWHVEGLGWIPVCDRCRATLT